MPKKQSKATRKALELAKKLESQPVPSRQEIAETYKVGMEEARKLQKLLAPEWFVRDAHPRKAKSGRGKSSARTCGTAVPASKPRRPVRKRAKKRK